MKEIRHKIEYRKLFEIATLDERIEARKELGWPTFEKEVERIVNQEQWTINL